MKDFFDTFLAENERFEGGNGAAGTRARKNIQEIVKLGKIRRNEITEEKKRRQEVVLTMK
tara:strand:- start:1519 stop:1698 length:180 start_codon:yes stop_codon:yes gene_type:complete